MRNNKMKGFTLVELLVVIAILAILATVSVVGYTSYIEGATVRVDEDLAAQLTRFLEAYKVNNPGEITEDNIWQITQDVLEESGVNELNPKAQQYGYHFYFDLAEGKYVLKNDTDVLSSLAVRLYNLLANAEDGTFEARPGNFFTEGNRYFLVDTAGSDLADVVRAFYTAEDTTDFIKNLNDKVSKLTVSGFSTLISNATFVTKDGNLGSGTGMIYVHDNAGSIEIPANTITPSATDTIIIPEGVSITSLGIAADKAVTVYIEADSWNEVKKLVDPGFVSDKVTVVLGGDNTKYTVVDAKVYKSDDYATNGENATVVATLTYNNPVHEFDIEIDHDFAVNNLTDAENLKGYIAFDKIGDAGLQLKVSNEKGKLQLEDSTNPYKISLPEYTWAITKIVMGDDSVVEDTTKYATIDPNTGVLTLTADYNFGIKYIEVEATAVLGKDGNLPAADGTYTVAPASETIEIHIASIDNNTFKVNGSSHWEWDEENQCYNVTLIHDKTDGNEYSLVNDVHYNFEYEGVKADSTISVSLDKDDYKEVITASENVIKTVGAGTAVVNVQIGQYITYKINVTVYDITTQLPIQPLHSNIKYVGNSDAIKLSELFVGDIPEGSVLKVFNYVAPNMTDYMTPDGSRTFITTDIEDGIYVDDEGYSIVYDGNIPNFYKSGKELTGTDDTIQFGGNSSEDGVTIAIFHNGVRISPDVTVVVVDGTNISDISEWVTDDSIVLLNNLTMLEEHARNKWYTLAAGETLYGNYFTFNIKAGIKSSHYGFIELSANSTMKDLRVVGSVFENIQLSGGSDWGTNAVSTGSGVTIDNCYIANCRAPLYVNGDITVNNTVLFGGRYANVDLRGGTLKFTGNNVLINQPYTDGTTTKKVVGVGIAVWLQADSATTKVDIEDASKFKQYNTISEVDAELLPPVTIEQVGVTFNLGNMFKSILGVCVRDHDHSKNCCTKEDGVHSHRDGWSSTCSKDGLLYPDYTYNDGTLNYVAPTFVSLNSNYTSFSNVNLTEKGYGTGTYTYFYIYNLYITAPKKDSALFTESVGAENTYAPDAWYFVGGEIIH